MRDPHIPLLLGWAIKDKAVCDREPGLVGAAAWNRPIARAVVVERLARRYLADGQLAAAERAAFIRTLGELKRPGSLPLKRTGLIGSSV